MLLRREMRESCSLLPIALARRPQRLKSKAFGQVFVYKREFFTFHFSLFFVSLSHK